MPDAVVPVQSASDSTKSFPPLLTVEHQELIRAVERLQVTLQLNRDHYDSKLNDHDRLIQTQINAAEKAMNAALLAAKEAVEKANNANEKRFENVNEFRGQLSDMQSTLISRVEAESRFTGLDEKMNTRFGSMDDQIKRIQSTIDKGFTAANVRTVTGKDNWGYLVGAVSLVAMAVTIILAFNN